MPARRSVFRYVLSAATALSALLCTGVVVFSASMWVRGMSVGDRLIWMRSAETAEGVVARDVTIWSARGGVGVYVSDLSYGTRRENFGPVWKDDAMVVYPYVPIPQLKEGRSMGGAGFTWFSRRYEPDSWGLLEERAFVFPWAAPLLLCLLPLVLIGRSFLARRRKSLRIRRGLCVGCGYDLRHSRERCPECGLVVVKAVC